MPKRTPSTVVTQPSAPRSLRSVAEEAVEQLKRDWKAITGSDLPPGKAVAFLGRLRAHLKGDVEVPDGSLARENVDGLIERLKKNDPSKREYTYEHFDPRTPRGIEPGSQEGQREPDLGQEQHFPDMDPDISLSR